MALLEIIIGNEIDVNVNIIQSSFAGSGRDDERTLTTYNTIEACWSWWLVSIFAKLSCNENSSILKYHVGP